MKVEDDDDDDDDDDDAAAAAADDEIEPVDADAEKVAVVVEPSLALVTVDVATVALADGVYSRSFEGNGTVVHHDPKESGLGLVLVDRNTVPVASCDVLVSFAAYPHEVAAKVEYLHPTHNFGIVSYDAAAMPRAAAAAVKTIRTHEAGDSEGAAIRRGDEVVLVGLSG